MENAIEVIRLESHYGDREVLKDVTVAMPQGKITTIVGKSGSGKSTLLKHLIGLLKPTQGEILISGKDIAVLREEELDEVRKKMGVLFQGAALLNSLSVSDNVALPIREHTRLNESTIHIMVHMKLDLVGLSGFENFYPSQLSGGMRKRAGLARAMALDPEFLFFDEPSSGLDPVTAAGLDKLILKLRDVFKITIVVVTHELPSLFMISDHVIMIDSGEAIFSGTLDELKKADDPRIKMFLERRPEEEAYSPDDYLRVITGD
ncbi:MAG TPA: ABC transporter ATP-binding protein [Nitrospiraceae bacterium]|jgi:phospholipid/cholesterol/gamma-HCH transport system ATP-binding protein|nr:ABC transporter ATP-binding protein [Nitrospiraceae bacterium]